jgi:hypothetical protein
MRFVHLQKFAGVIYDTARSSPPALSIYFFDETRLAPQTVAISKWTVDSAICKLESCFYQVTTLVTYGFRLSQLFKAFYTALETLRVSSRVVRAPKRLRGLNEFYKPGGVRRSH